MNKFSQLLKLKELYDRGENILQYLKSGSAGLNDPDSIMISYDCQAGSYTRLASQNAKHIEAYTDAFAQVLLALPAFGSIMEVGVGEATVMSPLVAKLDPSGRLKKFGFDISWSRARYALQNTRTAGQSVDLFMANLFAIPLADNAIDIVYTSHSLEPNGGREEAALQELFRVAGKYVVLLEPDYENASEDGKRRMEHHGYVRGLAEHARALGYDVVESRPFGISVNALNPTGLTVIRKQGAAASAKPQFICPVTKAALERRDNVYFSPACGLIYPIVDGVPCLIDSAAVLGLHFDAFSKPQ